LRSCAAGNAVLRGVGEQPSAEAATASAPVSPGCSGVRRLPMSVGSPPGADVPLVRQTPNSTNQNQQRINKNRQRNRTVRPSDRTATHATAAPAGTEGRCLQAHGRFPAPGQTIREIDRPPSLRPRKFYQPGPKKSIAAGLSFCRSAVCRSDRAQRTPSTGGPLFSEAAARPVEPDRVAGPGHGWGRAHGAGSWTLGILGPSAGRTCPPAHNRATNQAVDGVWT